MSGIPRFIIRYSFKELERIKESENSKKVPKKIDMWSTLLGYRNQRINYPRRCNTIAVNEKNRPSQQVGSSIRYEASICQSVSRSPSQSRQGPRRFSILKPRRSPVVRRGSPNDDNWRLGCSPNKQCNGIRLSRSFFRNNDIDLSTPYNRKDSYNNPGTPYSVHGSAFKVPKSLNGPQSHCSIIGSRNFIPRQSPLTLPSPSGSCASSASSKSTSDNIGSNFSDVSRYRKDDSLPWRNTVRKKENWIVGHSESKEAGHCNQFKVPKSPHGNASIRRRIKPLRTSSPKPCGPSVFPDNASGTSGIISRRSSHALRERNEIHQYEVCSSQPLAPRFKKH